MKTISIFLTAFFMISNTSVGSNSEKTKQKVFSGFEKMVQSRKNPNTGLLLIHSEKMNIQWKMATNQNSEVPTNPDQPFHFASIGKTITSTVVAMLYEQGVIRFDDSVSKFLDEEIMSGLHIYKGVDYSGQLLVKQLLNHTSGLPDYYMDKNKEGVRLLDKMVSEPDHFWTPIATINWAKQELRPKFAPGSGFHYSDTNYQLLGLIIEKLTGSPLHEAYSKFIFDPLEMKNSYMAFYSQPADTSTPAMTDLYYKGQNLSNAKSISMSWASGGVVSTSEDMLRFIRALNENKLIRSTTFDTMQDWARMGPGIKYGYGLMKFRFFGMPKKYEIWGNSGSIGAFMYYCPAMDVYIVGTFNKFGWQVQPIIYIIRSLQKLGRLSSK